MAKIKFVSSMDTEQILRDNPDAHAHADKVAMIQDGTVTVYVEPRNEFGTLEWLIRIASPKGLHSYQMRQLMPAGIISEQET